MRKIQVSISHDEWYPVYTVIDTPHTPLEDVSIEVDEEKYKEWSRIYDEFNDMQNELSEIVEKQKNSE